jgi:WD40 repeat protein
MIGKEEGVKAVAIGELSGKAVAIAGSANGAISVWDPSMSQRVEIPRIAHMAPILALVYVVIAGSPSVVVGYHDGFIRIWSLIDGKPLVSPILAHEGGVRALAVGSFNELSVIVSGGGAGDGAGGGEVRIWDLLTCRPLETLQGHNGPVNSIVIGRLESRSIIVSGSDDGTARVWDISPNWTKSGPSHSKGSIGCVAVSEYAGEFIAATGGYQRSFEVWNSSTGTLLHTFGAAASSEPVAIAAGTSSKGTLVLAACAGETVRLWQELPRNKQLDNVHHHQHRVTALALSLIDEANSVVATAIEDGTLRLLSVASPDLFCGPFRLKQRSRVRALTFGECQGKPMLISGDDDGVIQAWNVSNGNEMFQLLAHRSAVRSLYFCEHGDIPAIVSCGEDKMTVVWDADGRAFRMAQMIEHDSIVTSASLLPTQGNRIVVSGCIDGTIRLHHESGHLILSIDTGSEVVGLAVVDDDDLAVATKRGLMRIRIKDSIADFLWRRGFSPVA